MKNYLLGIAFFLISIISVCGQNEKIKVVQHQATCPKGYVEPKFNQWVNRVTTIAEIVAAYESGNGTATAVKSYEFIKYEIYDKYINLDCPSGKNYIHCARELLVVPVPKGKKIVEGYPKVKIQITNAETRIINNYKGKPGYEIGTWKNSKIEPSECGFGWCMFRKIEKKSDDQFDYYYCLFQNWSDDKERNVMLQVRYYE